MALSASASAFKAAVLGNLRMPVTTALAQPGVAMPSLGAIVRFMGGGFLPRDDVTNRVLYVTKHFEKINPAKLSPAAHFEKDLGLDSLDIVELVMAYEQEFDVEIADADAEKIFTVEDAVNYICSHPHAK